MPWKRFRCAGEWTKVGVPTNIYKCLQISTNIYEDLAMSRCVDAIRGVQYEGERKALCAYKYLKISAEGLQISQNLHEGLQIAKDV